MDQKTIDDVHRLQSAFEALQPKLDVSPYPDRLAYVMANLCSSWTGLCDHLLEDDSMWNFPAHAASSEEECQELWEQHGTEIAANPVYAAVMDLGQQVIARYKARKLDPDGYLGFLALTDDLFRFLIDEFGFERSNACISSVDYRSDKVLIKMQASHFLYGPAAITVLSDPETTYDLDDVMFFAGKRDSVVPTPWPNSTSREELRMLFTNVATLLRQYGTPILAGDEASFERLKVSWDDRQELLCEENERAYELEHGHRFDWTPYGVDGRNRPLAGAKQ